MLRQKPGQGQNNCIMAASPADLIEPFDGEETGEELSRKKKSKFQTFKNFFAKKKKKSKELSSPMGGGSRLKASQSSSDVNIDSSLLHAAVEPGSKGSMGNKALSHDSVFIFEALPDVAGQMASQENLPGKVKALQLRLQQNLRFGSPPLVITSKKMEDTGTVSEDDGLPRSPPEISPLHDILTCPVSKSANPVQRHRSLSLGGTDSEDEQVPLGCSSRPLSSPFSTALGSPAGPTCHLLPVDFNSPATPLGCLDTSVARHRIAMNPRRQKAFAHKAQNLSVEKEQDLLGPAEGKTGHEVSRQGFDGQEKNREGPSTRNASNLNGSWTNDVFPMAKTSDVLRYSWNAGPGVDEQHILASEDQNFLVTDLQANVTVSRSKPSSLVKAEGEGAMEEDVGKRTGYPIDDLELNPQSFGKGLVENTELSQADAKATRLCDTLLLVLHGNAGENLHYETNCPRGPSFQPGDQKAKGCTAGSGVTHVDGVGDSSAARGTSASLEAEPVLPILQLPASTLEPSSGAAKPTASALGDGTAITEATRSPADGEPQSFEGRLEQAASLPKKSAVVDANLDTLLLQRAVGDSSRLLKEVHCSLLSSSPSTEEADVVPKQGDLPSGGLHAAGLAESASNGSLPDGHTVDQLGKVKMRDERKAPEETAKAQTKATSAKPVRFTIAPAWQRSLSGGSNPVDGPCPRSTPSSPIRPELFEGAPQFDTASQGCTPNSPEQLERVHRNFAANLTLALEWSSDDGQGQESPFGVKLRRTSSLLRYQMEQEKAPRQVPPAASGSSSISAKDEPKPATSPSLTARTKALVAKPSFSEEKNPGKARPEDGATKPHTSRPLEQTLAAHLEAPSSEPAWISMAKLKQKGFQGHPLAKAEKEGKKQTGFSQQEKDANTTRENVLKKGSSHHVCTLESKQQSKVTASLTKGFSHCERSSSSFSQSGALQLFGKTIPSIPELWPSCLELTGTATPYLWRGTRWRYIDLAVGKED
ncbi:acrosomal protein KIAA1210 homolog isoform X2 [Varanus komodoensis]|uniref:acrosomal protein KIAA1210 homolog isoform X2 n=1 Tax=Varanus komodoensis TaxID=61221 RepID=UPI001CF7BDB2|nr:acrosomal protein KIAA1210 homolog isoform X2 [Varanus komodoensis]